MNAHEFNAASAYIYPGDHPKLYLYTQVLSKSPNTFIKLSSKRDAIIGSQKVVIAKFQCVNTSKFYENYMHGVRNLNLDGATFVDTIYIRNTNDGKCLSFDWANIEGESLKTAIVYCQDGISSANIRADMSTSAEIVGKIQSGETILIDDYSENDRWVKCFSVDPQCRVTEGYVAQNLILRTGRQFFTFGAFDSIGILFIGSIILILCVIPFLLFGLIEVFKSNPFGIFLLVGLVLGWIFLLYLTIEYLLFEIFIINLPYSLASLLA